MTIGVAPTVIVQGDPNRVNLILPCHESFPVRYWAGSPVSTSIGLSASAAGAPLIVRIEDVGPWITHAWYAVVTGATFDIEVLESLWLDVPPEDA